MNTAVYVFSLTHRVLLLSDGGPPSQSGEDLGRKEMLTLAGDRDDVVLCSHKHSQPLAQQFTIRIVYHKKLSNKAPREANCLCRARRDWSRPLSSFMVLSMWLALRELPTNTPWEADGQNLTKVALLSCDTSTCQHAPLMFH